MNNNLLYSKQDNKKSLIIFTRYPEIGKTKTRLIPAIGAEKACNLQRLMTESTVKKAYQLRAKFKIDINIYFHGGSKDLMQNWLGNNYNYYPQNGQDLGIKMYNAFGDSFAKNSCEVVIIGTDCLDLDENILNQAFNQLNNYDLVIGKAEDGGYYLLGLKSLNKDLFININWGSDSVFNTTVAIASRLNYSIYQLPTLRDIDRPEDLEYYRHKIIDKKI